MVCFWSEIIVVELFFVGNIFLVWVKILEKAKNKIRIPDKIENFFEKAGFLKSLELKKPISKRLGVVPRTKRNKIREPFNGFAEIKAELWAVKVKPQGKRKVRIPKITGEIFWEKVLFKNFLGNKEIFGRLMPKSDKER